MTRNQVKVRCYVIKKKSKWREYIDLLDIFLFTIAEPFTRLSAEIDWQIYLSPFHITNSYRVND